jgi:hypothetical protein
MVNSVIIILLKGMEILLINLIKTPLRFQQERGKRHITGIIWTGPRALSAKEK